MVHLDGTGGRLCMLVRAVGMWGDFEWVTKSGSRNLRLFPSCRWKKAKVRKGGCCWQENGGRRGRDRSDRSKTC